MKKYLFLLVIIIASGCSKEWLDLKQPGNNDDVYFVDASTAFEAVVAAYDVQAWRENIVALWAVGSVMSDDAIKGGESDGDQQGMFDCMNFSATPNTDVPYWIWRDLYKMVANSSFAIDIMIEKGLVNEVNELSKYKKLNALNTIGYKEIFKYLEKKINLEEAINEIKTNSRRYAKRQLTWFKANKKVNWYGDNYDLEEVLKMIKSLHTI